MEFIIGYYELYGEIFSPLILSLFPAYYVIKLIDRYQQNKDIIITHTLLIILLLLLSFSRYYKTYGVYYHLN
jgi:O-antigen ligase